MNAITNLQVQHHELASIMLRLMNLVEGLDGPAQAYPITVQLAKLAHLLRLHLVTEDGWFYPAMMAANEPAAASLATAYRDEVGGLAERVESFVAQWNSSAVIAVGFESFRTDLIALFHRIEERIGREDKELYPMARYLGIGQHPLAA